jgi:hypothetical protein
MSANAPARTLMGWSMKAACALSLIVIAAGTALAASNVRPEVSASAKALLATGNWEAPVKSAYHLEVADHASRSLIIQPRKLDAIVMPQNGEILYRGPFDWTLGDGVLIRHAANLYSVITSGQDAFLPGVAISGAKLAKGVAIGMIGSDVGTVEWTLYSYVGDSAHGSVGTEPLRIASGGYSYAPASGDGEGRRGSPNMPAVITAADMDNDPTGTMGKLSRSAVLDVLDLIGLGKVSFIVPMESFRVDRVTVSLPSGAVTSSTLGPMSVLVKPGEVEVTITEKGFLFDSVGTERVPVTAGLDMELTLGTKPNRQGVPRPGAVYSQVKIPERPDGRAHLMALAKLAAPAVASLPSSVTTASAVASTASALSAMSSAGTAVPTLSTGEASPPSTQLAEAGNPGQLPAERSEAERLFAAEKEFERTRREAEAMAAAEDVERSARESAEQRARVAAEKAEGERLIAEEAERNRQRLASTEEARRAAEQLAAQQEQERAAAEQLESDRRQAAAARAQREQEIAAAAAAAAQAAAEEARRQAMAVAEAQTEALRKAQAIQAAQAAEEMARLRAQLEQLRTAQQARDDQAQQRAAAYKPGRRKALVIGNDVYARVSKLEAARADAKAIGQALSSVGFDVSLHTDLSERAMKRAMREFKARVEGGDEVAFFFAGHGVQIDGINYLLPVDIAGQNEDQVRDEAVPLQRILDDMDDRKAGFVLAMIDACRDNPFRTTGRAIGGRGLAPTSAATGQMIIFSAGTGQQALDRLHDNDSEPNGVFTRVFLREMVKPGISVDRVLRNVRQEVVQLARSVGKEQTPALYDQAVGDFFFKP